jgi:hypothetical protein
MYLVALSCVFDDLWYSNESSKVVILQMHEDKINGILKE